MSLVHEIPMSLFILERSPTGSLPTRVYRYPSKNLYTVFLISSYFTVLFLTVGRNPLPLLTTLRLRLMYSNPSSKSEDDEGL